ncbi:hypothetical protein Zmor_019121 [Zophobas morio]|uniref:MPN domain-containing protein n=1 Tax=Zophobas morio TaxID=2755281 RepID=A0AA38LZV2_9CUCU|nr:hypothetical protein Zmor_019121 [Zophobas morio]
MKQPKNLRQVAYPLRSLTLNIIEEQPQLIRLTLLHGLTSVPPNLSPVGGGARYHTDLLLTLAGLLSQAQSGEHGIFAIAEAKEVAQAHAPLISKRALREVVEDPVDVILSNEAGLIKRSYDPLKCKHCLKDKCLHCVDLEPFDEEYLKEKKIKFMSFQTFTRFLKKRQSNDKCFSLPRWRFTVRSDCSHPSWPKGLCSRCQPTALTLNSQPFRHVDYVEFESPQVLDMFLDYWRSSGGRQRFGFLIGQYEPFYDVPLGVKARVAAIYEPPQESDAFTLQLLDDPQETVLHGLLSQLGLAVVGCIFTDLENAGGGLVRHKRHKDTFFLSSFECILAAEFQNKYRSPCKLAEEGYYGSKFVTVVVSGNQEGQVGLEAYQISNQGMSLVSAGLLRPTTAFDKGAVQPVDSSQYVPDVLYSFKDEYGNTVPASADPFFPLDFLLVNVRLYKCFIGPLNKMKCFFLKVGAGAPVAQGPVTFASSTPGNRVAGHATDACRYPQIIKRNIKSMKGYLPAVKQHVESSATPLLALSDFHLLLHLATSDVYSLQVVLSSFLNIFHWPEFIEAFLYWLH